MKHVIVLKKIIAGCACLCLSVAVLRASAGALAPIAPLLDDQSYAVVRLDLEQLDVKALFARGLELAQTGGEKALLPPAATNDLMRAQDAIQKWISDFRAAGGRSLYVLTYASDGPAWVVAIPSSGASQRQALAGLVLPLLQHTPIGEVEQREKDDILLLGTLESLDRLLASKTANRPDLVSAFAFIPNYGLQGALALTPDQRRVLEEMAAKIPLGQEVFAGQVLTRGCAWGALGINLNPKMGVLLAIQSADATAAQDFRKFLQTGLHHLIGQSDFKSIQAVLEPLLTQLLPRIENDRLVLELPDTVLNGLLDSLRQPLSTLVTQEQAKAERIMTMNKIKQILLACIMYNDDKKAYPPQLKDLGSYLPDKNQLRSSRYPNRDVGFEYLPPGKNSAQYPAATHLVIYESFETWPAEGLGIGFLDGHSEITANKERFEQLLNEAKERNAAK